MCLEHRLSRPKAWGVKCEREMEKSYLQFLKSHKTMKVQIQCHTAALVFPFLTLSYLWKSYVLGPRLQKYLLRTSQHSDVDSKLLSLRESKRSSTPPAHSSIGCVLHENKQVKVTRLWENSFRHSLLLQSTTSGLSELDRLTEENFMQAQTECLLHE